MPDTVSTEKLLHGQLQILQAKDGYRYSIDPFLLVSFIRGANGTNVIDLGSGSGVIPLLLAKQYRSTRITGLEMQVDLVERAQRSVVLNGLQEQIVIMQGDVRELPGKLAAGQFDMVVSNPPYRMSTAGRVSLGTERSLARHELAGNLADFLRAGCFLLNSGGRMFMIHLAERMAELMVEMRSNQLEPKRLRVVHSRSGEEAKLILIEGRKGGRPGLRVEPPLILYKGTGRDYTEEVLAMYGR